MGNIILLDDHSMILNGLSLFIENTTSNKIICKLQSLNELSVFLRNYDSREKTIAIVDIQLNGESGFEAIHTLSNYGIPTLMYSMFSSSAYVVKATELGAKGYITKSASDSELLEAITAVFNNQVYIQKDLVPKFMFTANILNSLTSKEKQIVDFVKEDLSNDEIGEKMNISKRTVENHLSRIYDKFGVQDKHQLRDKLK